MRVTRRVKEESKKSPGESGGVKNESKIRGVNKLLMSAHLSRVLNNNPIVLDNDTIVPRKEGWL